MKLHEQPGGHVLVAEAPVWDNSSPTLNGRNHLLLGRMPYAVLRDTDLGFTWYLGQLYGVVCPGLIFAQHLFEGLKRDMMVEDDENAAAKKLAATWSQPRDARLIGSDPFNMKLEYYPAEQNRIFCVYISRNEMLEEFPHIFGWREHWTWIAADPTVPGAPIDYGTRYDRQLWGPR